MSLEANGPVQTFCIDLHWVKKMVKVKKVKDFVRITKKEKDSTRHWDIIEDYDWMFRQNKAEKNVQIY